MTLIINLAYEGDVIGFGGGRALMYVCICNGLNERKVNDDIVHLYNRSPVGTRVRVI